MECSVHSVLCGALFPSTPSFGFAQEHTGGSSYWSGDLAEAAQLNRISALSVTKVAAVQSAVAAGETVNCGNANISKRDLDAILSGTGKTVEHDQEMPGIAGMEMTHIDRVTVALEKTGMLI